MVFAIVFAIKKHSVPIKNNCDLAHDLESDPDLWNTLRIFDTSPLQARIQKKLDEELPQERMVGIKLGPKVSGNQGLSKS